MNLAISVFGGREKMYKYKRREGGEEPKKVWGINLWM